jgi:hypothetical protein
MEAFNMTNVQISLHDGTVIQSQVESYSATDITSNMNDPKVLAIHIGNAVFNKNIIKYVAPVPPTA